MEDLQRKEKQENEDEEEESNSDTDLLSGDESVIERIENTGSYQMENLATRSNAAAEASNGRWRIFWRKTCQKW